jgi:hypothetical protein
MFHATIMLDMYSVSVSQNRDLPSLQAGKGLPKRERGHKAHAQKVFEIHALLR